MLYILNNDLIASNIFRGNYIKGLYALALLDLLCKKKGYDLVSDYDDFRTYSLKEAFYPTSIAKDGANKKKKYIPEFLRYNIYEEELDDAC